MTGRKPSDRRQGRGTKDAPEDAVVVMEAPDPPRGVSDEVIEAWDTFWSIVPLAAKVGAADVLALKRLFQLYHVYIKTIDDFIAEPYVLGERGKLVAHPGWNIANAAMRQILPLEKQFGVTPRARAELGINLDVPTGAGPSGKPMDFTGDDDDE